MLTIEQQAHKVKETELKSNYMVADDMTEDQLREMDKLIDLIEGSDDFDLAKDKAEKIIEFDLYW
jgi:hypothetical protein